MTRRKDLRKIANKVFDRCLEEDWRPSTKEIRRRYKLDDDQILTVKRYTKQIGEFKGILWGYHPEINAFRLCPNNAPEVAKSMLQYALEHWADNGVNVNTQVRAAKNQGYITAKSSGTVEANNEDAAKEIRKGFHLLEFRSLKNLETSSVRRLTL